MAPGARRSERNPSYFPSLRGHFGAVLGLEVPLWARLRFPAPARISEPGSRRGAASVAESAVPPPAPRRTTARRIDAWSGGPPQSAANGRRGPNPAAFHTEFHFNLAGLSPVVQGNAAMGRAARSGWRTRLCGGGETGLCRKPRGYCKA